MIASQFDLVWYRRKTFWIAIVGIGMVLTLALSLLIMLVSADEFTDDLRWFSAQSIISTVGGIIGMILGATMGALDRQNGMSRYIALTGTSRPLHALGRLAGAMLTWITMIALTTAVAAVAMLAIRGWPEEIDQPLRLFLAVALPGLTYVVIAFGLGRLLGSSGFSIAITMGVVFVLEPFLNVLPKIGTWWQEVSLKVASERLKLELFDPGGTSELASDFGLEGVQTSVQSVAVLLAWMLLPLVVGIWVDQRRDL